MKQIVETGTDAATVCFFDPEALPKDFDKTAKDDPYDTLLQLSKEGRVWFQETGSDGAFLFHFYIDEEIPERIRARCEDPKTVNQFLVPSGTICACGSEYAALKPLDGHEATPSGGLAKFPHMGGCFQLEAGNYLVNASRIEWSDNEVKSEITKRLGGKRNQNRLGVLTGILFLATMLGTLFTAFKTLTALTGGKLGIGFLWAWGILLLGWVICIPLMRLLSKWEKDPMRREIEREFPSIVVHMNKLR